MFKDFTNDDALVVATKAVELSEETTCEITSDLWIWHKREEMTRTVRLEHKAIKQKLKAKKKQTKLQENIAKTEQETKEALEKDEMP